MKTFWITFYSYKGGVGRSLALANTAALLAKQGRRVVLIDFDLEAPGLDSFQEFWSIAGKPGVVEYVAAFEASKKAPEINQFVHECSLPDQLRGKLWIMPAGRKDKVYNSLRAKLDWIRLYDSGLGGPFVENWKAAINRHCRPDFVLIDSRTGLTDIGGICTLHLPDLVVMLFGLNEQNVRGIAAVAKAIRESDFKSVPQLYYVASPVPNLPRDKESPFAKRWLAATEILGTSIESSIRYQPIVALKEKLFVLDEQKESPSLDEDYNNLLTKLIDYNRSGIDFLVKQAREAIIAFDNIRIERLISIFQEEFHDRPESLMIQAELKLSLGDSVNAFELAHQALRADPLFPEPLNWLIIQYKKWNRPRDIFNVCNDVLQHPDKLAIQRLISIHSSRGESAMRIGEFASAVESYDFCMNREVKGNRIPILLLTHSFNLFEAARRRDNVAHIDGWKSVIDFFEKAGEVTSFPLVRQANHLQAMHIPFALNGDVTRARDALRKARLAAELVGLAEDVYTVKNYADVPVKEWLQINDEMLASLDFGRLWDGMPLKSTY